VSNVTWLYSKNLSVLPKVLDVQSDPKLSKDGFSLNLKNVTGEYEAIYFCLVQYSNGGGTSYANGIGCVFVAGKASRYLEHLHGPLNLYL
jgi:hypothetical protein